jgi:hypothetical protein
MPAEPAGRLVDLGEPLSEPDPGSPEALRLRTSIHEDLAMRHAIQLQ